MSPTTNILHHMSEICKLLLRPSFLDYLHHSGRSVSAFKSITEIQAQIPQSSVKNQNSLYPSDAIYNSNTSQSLGSKNISLTPYRMTEEHYLEHGILKNVGNVTNN
jgi:hypothetical protein